MFTDDPGLFNNLLTFVCGSTVTELAPLAIVVMSGDDAGSISCFFVAGKSSSTSALGVLLEKKTARDKGELCKQQLCG